MSQLADNLGGIYTTLKISPQANYFLLLAIYLTQLIQTSHTSLAGMNTSDLFSTWGKD